MPAGRLLLMGDYEIRVSWANFGKQAPYQGGDKMQLLGRYPADVGHISARASEESTCVGDTRSLLSLLPIFQTSKVLTRSSDLPPRLYQL